MQTKLNITQLRAAFWSAFPEYCQHFRKSWRQNRYNATIRTLWVDFVDAEHRNGGITDSVASRATL